MLRSTFLVSTSTLGCAAAVSLLALSASSPALADFVCTAPTSNPLACTNSTTAAAPFTNNATGTDQSATTTNSGTANGFATQTTGGGDASVTNSGTNLLNGMLAQTTNGGNATATNSGINTGDNVVALTFTTGNAAANNSGSIGNASSLDFSFLQARAIGTGNATATNSGSVAGGVAAVTLGGGTAAATNSGNTPSSLVAITLGGGDATATNSGSASGIAAVAAAGGNATVINSGVSTSNNVITVSGVVTLSGGIAAIAAGGNATLINTGVSTNTGGAALLAAAAGNAAVINSGMANGGIDVIANGVANVTNVVGGRVIGPIDLGGVGGNVINFQGGNWLFTIATAGGPTTINTGGAPFVVSGPFSMAGAQVAVLDPTTFALADRSLTNFTGEISEMLQGRFGGMSTGAGGGALGFAGSPSSPVADQAQAVFSGIPSVAMSYASNPRPIIGKAPPPAATPYYDTTVWASGFGGERKQRADGAILPTTDSAFGGTMGVDRALGGNLRVGAFVGAGASREQVDFDVQKIDATYVFGGAYGRFDWISQFLDFALYGGGIDNKSTRQIANNTVPSGVETATASYGGWFISPEVIYGFRIPVNAITVTPRLRVRYVGGQLDGYSESGSMQNLTVGRRNINDFEERGEIELSTVSGALKAAATVGVIGLERAGNPTINTVLLGQNLSFVTPGQANAFGGVFGMRVDYRVMANVALFAAGEGTVMSDKSYGFAATGGARVSF